MFLHSTGHRYGSESNTAGQDGGERRKDPDIFAQGADRSDPRIDAGSFSAVYREVEPSGVSYAAFLRRFLCADEVAAVDPDSIDRVWYHVGLEQLGDIPIIEPDELREDSDRLSLAVALDTSGSCCGEVMKNFLRELMSILQSFPALCVTLLQCDTKIRRVHQLTSEEDVEELFRSFRMCGGGGTDFRPVFSYLDEQFERGEKAPFRGFSISPTAAAHFRRKRRSIRRHSFSRRRTTFSASRIFQTG